MSPFPVMSVIDEGVDEVRRAARGVHVGTDEAVRRCLRAGVRSIEHANFVRRDVVATMAEYRVSFDQTFIPLVQRIEGAVATPLPDRIVSNLERTVARVRTCTSGRSSTTCPPLSAPTCGGPDAQKSQLR